MTAFDGGQLKHLMVDRVGCKCVVSVLRGVGISRGVYMVYMRGEISGSIARGQRKVTTYPFDVDHRDASEMSDVVSHGNAFRQNN